MAPIALVLIAAGLVAMWADLHLTQHGSIAALGLLATAAGVVWLLASVWPFWSAVLVGVVLLAGAGLIGGRILNALRVVSPVSLADPLGGRLATVSSGLAPEGWVSLHGVLWKAVSPTGTVPAGTTVLVVGRRGLTLSVMPLAAGELERIKLAS